jgi:hypothetical protein
MSDDKQLSPEQQAFLSEMPTATETPASTEAPKVETPAATETPAPTETPVTTEAPKVEGSEEPKVETPAEPTPPPSITDEIRLQAINETFGTDFKTKEDAEVFKASLSEVPTLREIKTKYEELSKKPIIEFASPEIEALNKFTKATGIADATIAKELKRFEATAEKNPIDALLLSEILENPAKIEDKAMLRRMLQSKYDTTLRTDEHGDPLEGDELQREQQRVEEAKYRLKYDAQSATDKINAVSEKVNNAEAGTQTISDQATKQETLKAQWSNILVDKADQLFTKIPVVVPMGKDEQGNVKYETIDNIEITPKDAKMYAEEAVAEIVRSGLELNEANLRKAVSDKYDSIKARNLSTITEKIHAHAESNAKLAAEKATTNPSQIKIETPASSQTPQSASEAVDAYMKEMGG